MKRILCTVLVLTFAVSLNNTHLSKTLWAHGEVNGYTSHESVHQTKAEVQSEKAEPVKDPVCGMEVIDIKKAPSEEYKGKTYYFCSENCKKTFKKSPKSYIEGLLKR